MDFPDIADWWEHLAKPSISQFLKQFSIMLSRERRGTKAAFYILLSDALNAGVAGYSEALELKARISEILLYEAEGLKIRSRFKENQEKEKASLYHLAREKKRGGENNLEKLLINGQVETSKDVCEAAVLDFYEPLLNGRQGRQGIFTMDRTGLPFFLNDTVGKLSDLDRDSLDKLFTEDELLFCIQNLPGNKSPGLDGFTNELYKKIYPCIKTEYLEVQNTMIRRGYMNPSMREGVTRLIPKVSDVPAVDQLRPITMLTADYAIRSRILTQRMSLCMEDIITSGQLCGSKKKNILSGIHNIFSTIEYVNRKELSAAVVSFDMDKAFDRCYIPYVAEVMKQMNFSEDFIKLITDMHDGASTRFILNGLTKSIPLTFSIRQGDPIAMFLYIINMEPFLLSLRQICKGVQIAGFPQIDEDYADDVEALVEDEDDFIKMDDLFLRFEKVSGALLSRSKKSKVLGLGGWKDRQVWPLPWLQTKLELKIFGFQVLGSYEEILERNWSTLVQSVQSTIMSYDLRCLNTLQQRTDVLNIYIYSRIWYKCQALPMPPDIAKRFEQLAFRFLWRGKLEKLALEEVHCSVKKGGLGLVEIRSKAEALFVKQSCRMLADHSGQSYKHIQYWLGLYLGNYLPDLRRGPHSEQTPTYYKQFRRLLEEMAQLELIDFQALEEVKVKDIYQSLTETLPPPKVMYKHNLPWDLIWHRINHVMLGVQQRELLFLLVHNVLPTKERLHRLNQVDSAACSEGDGVESVEHLFCTCRRVQVAWAWMRRKLMNRNLALPTVNDFELIHLVNGVDSISEEKDLIFLISNYVDVVWKLRSERSSYLVDVDEFITYLQFQHKRNQQSQNKVSADLF